MVRILAPVLAAALLLGHLPPAAAVDTVPEEPGAIMLPDRPTLQAVVADLRGAGSRDLVRLVEGDRGSVSVEVWRHREDGWSRVGDEVEVVPEPTDESWGNLVYAGTPVRLLVRADGARERVTIARQPHWEPAGGGPLCCLLLHDVEVDGTAVSLRAVGSADDAVDTILALDLDGDGIDELLAKRSLPPVGRISYPSEALVFRWRGEAFAAPITSELSIGSGNSTFVLGETDGRPGDEAGIITTATRFHLYRIVLDRDDRVRAEAAGAVVLGATPVAVDGRPAVAVIGPVPGIAVHPWPSGGQLAPAIGRHPASRGRLIGPVALPDGPALILESEPGGELERLALPDLASSPMSGSPEAGSIERASAGPLRPYRGILPGGGPDGEPAWIVDGSLLPGVAGADEAPEPMPLAALGGVQPLGLVGPGRGWFALAHGIGPNALLDPAGGILGAPSGLIGGGISLAPIELVARPERDGGLLEPSVQDAAVLDAEGTLGIAAEGFRARIVAPAGSGVHVGVGDGAEPFATHRVPEAGSLELTVPLPRALLPYAGDRVTVALTTPAGATYSASWTVLALTSAPPLTVETATSLGSPTVGLEGTTTAFATVTVDGAAVAVDVDGRFSTSVELPPWPVEVEVAATDPVGNTATVTVTGIGVLDYRALPWIPITVALLAVAATVLYVRAPRRIRAPYRGDDGAVLEELDPGREA